MIAPDRHGEAMDTEVLLRRVLDLVNSAPKMPLSSTVRLEKDEVVEMLEEAIARLPEEMRQARWLLKERQEYLAKVQREGDEILNAARERAERIGVLEFGFEKIDDDGFAVISSRETAIKVKAAASAVDEDMAKAAIEGKPLPKNGDAPKPQRTIPSRS